MTNTPLRTFADAINMVGAASRMNLGIGLPGLGQGAASVFGGMSGSNDVIVKLHKTTAAFAGAYQQKSPIETLEPLAKEIQGHLFMLQTLGIITPERCDELAAQLDELMAARH
jgi:hypothetical protein